MGFLDNSGDIILDAVLTDTGRMRLSRGDGSFKIDKYAFGDDEINYALYRNSNHSNGAHPSGSAYYDLDILQTPVLEAFTNNTSILKSRLLSIPRTDLLYLPMLKLNEEATQFQRNNSMNPGFTAGAINSFFVTCDDATTKNFDAGTTPGIFQTNKGIISGLTNAGSIIRLDQGLDTPDIPPSFGLSPDLVETEYMIEIDNRLGYISSTAGSLASYSFIDDDNIALYNLTLGTDGNFVKNSWTGKTDTKEESDNTIEGPRGTRIEFQIRASTDLQTSNYLFERMGTVAGSDNWTDATDSTTNVSFIDTIVRVTGATTGYRVDIPIRFLKKVS